MDHVARDYLSVVEDDTLQQINGSMTMCPWVWRVLMPPVVVADDESAGSGKGSAGNQLSRSRFVVFGWLAAKSGVHQGESWVW